MLKYEQEMSQIFSVPRTRRLFTRTELAEVDQLAQLDVEPPLDA